MPEKPLLSICIPTFNRSHLLDACLASILPQAANFPQVECVISDNSSTDQTATIIQKYAQQFHIRTFRNTENLGVLGNITQVASKFANGQFVWLLGDDDILAEGAVAQVVELLESTAGAIDFVAVNVGFFPIEKRPKPDEAWGGIRDTPRSTSRQSALQGVVEFNQLFEGPKADFTPMYAAVIRQKFWADEFVQPVRAEEAFTSVRTTYPHAFILTKYMSGKKAGIVSAPIVCNYEMPAEQFSWTKFHALTVVLHLTSLMKLFEDSGISRQTLDQYYRYQLNHRGLDLGNLIWDKTTAGGWADAVKFAWLLRSYPLGLLKVFIVACGHSMAPKILRWPIQRILNHRSRQ